VLSQGFGSLYCSDKGPDSVKKWTKEFNVFDVEHIAIPVHAATG
jgi:Ulp1 family protease